MKIVKNFFWNAGYQIFVLLIPLLTIPYVNRVLGPVGIGINSYTNSIVQYFILLGSLGVNIYGNREIAYNRDSRRDMSAVFWELAVLRFVTIGISVFCYLFFISLTKEYHLFYYLQGIMLVGTALDISWFFQGLENFRVTVLRNAFVKILSLVLIFTFVRTAEDTWIYVLILALSQAVGYLTLWPQLGKYVSRPHFGKFNLRRHIRPSLTLLIPQIATQVYLQLNKTMLGAFKGVEAAGFYDNSDKIVKMVLALVTATGTVLLPHVAHSFANGDHKAVRRSLEMSMHIIMVLAFPLCLGLVAIAEPFTTLFFSEKFAAVGPLMAVESVLIILIGISNAVGTQYLLPTNQLPTFTTSVVLGSIVNIILNVPLILLFGTMGAVVATVTSEAVVSLFQLVRVRRQVQISRLFSETGKYMIAAGLMWAIIKLVQGPLPVTAWALVLQIGVGVLSYAVLLFVLRPRVLFGYARDLRASRAKPIVVEEEVSALNADHTTVKEGAGTRMKITVLVVTYNRLDLLKKCMRQIAQFRARLSHVVVVDNASTDGTSDYLDSLGRKIHVMHLDENVGGAGGFNAGVRYFYEETQDDAVWLLDDDTMLNEAALDAFLKAAESVGEFGFLASNVRWTDGTPAAMNVPMVEQAHWTENTDYVRIKRATFVSLFVPRTSVQAVGYPIKEFFIWGDDTEYTERISKRFPAYFVADSKVTHEIGVNQGADLLTDKAERIGRYYYAYRNRMYNARHGGRQTHFKYWLRVADEFVRIPFKSPDHRFKRMGVLIRGTVAGVFFRPKIEQAKAAT